MLPTEPPHPALARRFDGSGPFDEVWFIEASLDKNRGLWLRHVLTHDGHRPVQSTWAAVVDRRRVVARRAEDPLSPTSGDAVFEGPHGCISRNRARGRVGELSWDLAITGGWRCHDHVPERLARLGVTGRHYVAAALDALLTGTLEVGAERWELDKRPAVVGHIWGSRANTSAWAWCHCGDFLDAEDTAFEGLSARLTLGGVTLPPATSLVLHHQGEVWSFTRTRSLFTVESSTDQASWRFAARTRTATLRGHARLPRPSQVVTARQPHGDGHVSWVKNSPLSSLDLALVDDRHGRIVTLSSRRAAFELASRSPVNEGEDFDTIQGDGT